MPNPVQEKDSSPIKGVHPLEKGAQLRVLAVIPGPGLGASMIFARRQAKSLTGPTTDIRSFFLNSRMSPLRLSREWYRLRREIHNYQPHIVHAHYGTITALLCALSTSRPVVITFRGSDLNFHPEVGFWRSRMGYVLSQIAALRSVEVICVSSQLRRRLWFSRRRAVVIPDGVDLNLFRPLPKAHARALLGWDQKVPTVVFNTSARPRAKGIELVEAALRVAERRVGHIQMAILNGMVPPSDVPLFLSAADCAAVASFSEGSPNIVKEAMACNLPVVSVDVGDVVERLTGVHPSRIVARDPEEFGNALADILTAGLRSNGRDVVVECSDKNIAKRIHSIYERYRFTRHGRNFAHLHPTPTRDV